MFGSLLGKITGKSEVQDNGPVKRSGKWTKVRNEYLAKNPVCVACGKKTDLEVHHKKPLHTHPHLELKESNLMTLCKHHHKYMGHLGYTKSWNKDAESDAKKLFKKMSKRPLKG